MAPDSTGALTLGTPAPLQVLGAVVAERADGPNVYVLSRSGGRSPGGTVSIYAVGTDGALTNVSSTPIAANYYRTDMVLVATQ